MNRFARPLERLEKVPSAEVALWLARGFVNAVKQMYPERSEEIPGPVDPFAPHHFVNDFSHPVEAISSIYPHASFELQRALHGGIQLLGTKCRPKLQHADDGLTPSQRLALMQAFFALSWRTGCLESLQVVANIACEDAADWDEAVFRRKIFPECALCLEELAFEYDACIHKTASHRAWLVGALHRIVQQEQYFQPKFAPRALGALISVDPDMLLDHLSLLGPLVAQMHRLDKSQEERAHLTARRIVDKALYRLRAIFPSLEISSPAARDHWLFMALFGENGPLRAVSTGRDDSMVVFIGARIDARLTFYHDDLLRILARWLPESGALPAPSPGHKAEQQMARMRAARTGYFRGPKKPFDFLEKRKPN
jgi:hypothetical protein